MASMAFTRRDFFWYFAGAVTVVVIGLLVEALSGSQNNSQADLNAPRETSPSVASITTAPAPESSVSMDDMRARLEGRLAAQGGSDSDWELLAQSYEFAGRTDDAKLARAHQLPPTAMTSASPSVSPAGGDTSVAGVASIAGHVDVAAALKSKVPDGLTLFIIAKDVDSQGPPVAIVRTTSGHWPLSFTLNDSNAMMPGHSLSSAKRVTIEARVSRGGMASPQPGDFQSSITTIDAHQATPVKIVIDHIIG
jgi:hypothetical protein